MGGPWNRRKKIKRMPPKKVKKCPKQAKKGRRKS